MPIYNVNMFRAVTNHKFVNVKRAVDTWAECFNYSVNFQTKQSNRQDASLRYAHFLYRGFEITSTNSDLKLSVGEEAGYKKWESPS